MKLKPSEKKVLFVSMKRCGVGWVIHTLGRIHRKMFNGTPIKFYGIPRVAASKPNFEIPEGYGRGLKLQGWAIAYNVDPLKMLNAGFERVIVIQRDFETLMKAYEVFFYRDIQKKNFGLWDFANFKKNYETVYQREIDNPKYLKMRLEDLNAYTVITFNKLMDFLDFPKENRPILMPIAPPERYWQVYSSVLSKGHGHSDRLEDIKKNRKEIEEMLNHEK